MLDLSGNRLPLLPAPVTTEFSALRSLFLNQVYLKKIKNYFLYNGFRFQNRLSRLPEEIGLLVQLEFLSAAYNFLEDLPDSVEQVR